MNIGSNVNKAAHGPVLELVVAVSENDVIGRANQLPWHMPADLKHFKSLTVGKPVLMGRKTYESIGKPLPGRTNIVLSRLPEFKPSGCVVVKTLDEALLVAGEQSVVMVIGGAEIFRQSLKITSRIHLTLIHTQVTDGDTFFPGWRDPEWHESSRERHAADEKNTHDYSFITLDRR